MRIALVQTSIYWEDIQANLSNLEEKIWKMDKVADVIILPEMFSTGFSMNAEKLSEPSNLTTHKWMKQIAAQTMAAITGSYIVRDNGKFYNRLIWVQPDGTTFKYDKRHVFTMAGEDKVFEKGKGKLIVEWKGWKFCPLICYDLRFPVWSRNTKAKAYDCVIYVANWPQQRAIAWNGLLKARAIENISYTIGVNRIGNDNNGNYYHGDSSAYDFCGNLMTNLSDNEEIIFVDLDKGQLDDFRKKFPALEDGDGFEIKN